MKRVMEGLFVLVHLVAACSAGEPRFIVPIAEAEARADRELRLTLPSDFQNQGSGVSQDQSGAKPDAQGAGDSPRTDADRSGDAGTAAVAPGRESPASVPAVPTVIPSVPTHVLKVIDEQAGEIADLKSQATEANSRNDELSRAVEKLAGELIELKASKAVPPPPPIEDAEPPVPKVDRLEAYPTPGPSLSLIASASGGQEQTQTATIFTGEDVYGVGWCVNCPGVLARFGAGGDGLTIEHSRSVAPGVQTYPAFRWKNAAGRWVMPTDKRGHYSPPKDAAELREWIESTGPQQPVNVAASGVGGALQTGGRVRRLLSEWSTRLGPDASVSLRIDRTGLQSMSVTKLMHGIPWTAVMVCGKFGHVLFSTTSTKMPLGIQEIGFTYRLLDNGRFVFAPDPLTITLPGGLAPQTAGAVAVGFIDPVSIGFDLWYAASALYQILNPQTDVGLGGTVSLSAVMSGPDKLILTFVDCPSIHVAAWFKFDLEVQRVEITPTNVHIAFKPQPQNWIRIDSRDFPVSDAQVNAIGAADEMPAEQLAESADEPETDPRAIGASNPDDPHNDPRWHAFRRAWIKEHPDCQWKGCNEGGKGMNVHHVWPESWVAKVARPDLGYTRIDGQEFLTLCRPHHELAHNIGHGGSWKVFNPDAVHDAKVGKWNSRGQSEWFASEAKAVTWIKDQIRTSKTQLQSKTTLAP